MSSKQWEVLDRSKVNNFANRPLYLCRISVSDSSLVKIYQRIDRPPSLLLDVSSLYYIYLFSTLSSPLGSNITLLCFRVEFKLLVLDESFIGILSIFTNDIHLSGFGRLFGIFVSNIRIFAS